MKATFMIRVGLTRILWDLLRESIRENWRLKRLVKTQQAEIALLNQRRHEFEPSADTELPALLRPQA